MTFETESDVLAWYEKQPRVVDSVFQNSIPWKQINDYPIDPKFIPVLFYMRDIETMTQVYFDELMMSPTGKDPSIAAFMERWVAEEPTHGELLNRFLEESGHSDDKAWKDHLFGNMSIAYRMHKWVQAIATAPFGKRFGALHMAWGATHEYSTLTGYRRLWELAQHPVLEHILRGIVREEAMHAFFYWTVAKIKLERNGFDRKLARFILDRLWNPVGQEFKNKSETDLVIRTLFCGSEGVEHVRRYVSDKIRQLPGFETMTRVDDRISATALSL